MDELKTDAIKECLAWNTVNNADRKAEAKAQLAALQSAIAWQKLCIEQRDARIAELENDDTVPRSRYNACNTDWIEERDKRRDAEHIINSRDSVIHELNKTIATLEKQLTEARAAQQQETVTEIDNRAGKVTVTYPQQEDETK